MSEGLNLLPNRAKFRALRSLLQKKVNLFMWIFGAILMTCSLVVIGFLIFTRQSLNKSIGEYNVLKTESKTMSDVFSTSWGVKYRAKTVGKLLSDRFEYGKSIEKVNSLFSKKINISSLEIKEINDFLVDGTIDSNEGMDEIEKLIEEADQDEELDTVELISLNKVSSIWKFKLGVKLK